MYDKKAPKNKMQGKKDPISGSCFSRWGQKLDQLFDAPGLSEASGKNSQNKVSSDMFKIHRSKAPKKLLTQVGENNPANNDSNFKRHLEEAAFGSRIHKQFEPKPVKNQIIATEHDRADYENKIFQQKDSYIDKQREIDADRFLFKQELVRTGMMSQDHINRVSVYVGDTKFIAPQQVVADASEEGYNKGVTRDQKCKHKKPQLTKVQSVLINTETEGPVSIPTDHKGFEDSEENPKNHSILGQSLGNKSKSQELKASDKLDEVLITEGDYDKLLIRNSFVKFETEHSELKRYTSDRKFQTTGFKNFKINHSQKNRPPIHGCYPNIVKSYTNDPVSYSHKNFDMVSQQEPDKEEKRWKTHSNFYKVLLANRNTKNPQKKQILPEKSNQTHLLKSLSLKEDKNDPQKTNPFNLTQKNKSSSRKMKSPTNKNFKDTSERFFDTQSSEIDNNNFHHKSHGDFFMSKRDPINIEDTKGEYRKTEESKMSQARVNANHRSQFQKLKQDFDNKIIDGHFNQKFLSSYIKSYTNKGLIQSQAPNYSKQALQKIRGNHAKYQKTEPFLKDKSDENTNVNNDFEKRFIERDNPNNAVFTNGGHFYRSKI